MRYTFLVVPLALLFVGSGCRQRQLSGSGQGVVPSATSASMAEPLTRDAGGITGHLVVSPTPPRVMKPCVLRLELRDAKGQPIAGRKVGFDLTMPAMAMPPNRPQATERSSGVYEAAATFTMSGAWEVNAEVSGGNAPASLAFPLAIP